MSGPRVLLDATAVPADRGGVGRYVDSLAPALVAGGADLSVVCQPRDLTTVRALAPGARVVAGPQRLASRPVRLAWEQTGLPRLARRLGAQVVHSPHYTMPLTGRFARVVTLHDATFFSDPALHSAVKARFFRTWNRLAVRSSALLVVPSQATGREIAAHTGCPADRFRVAYHGVDAEVFHPASDAERARVRATLGLAPTERYIAFLGTLEPRKNVPALVDGWVSAVRDLPDAPALVLAGGSGWDPQIEVAAARVPPGLHLVRPGYLPLSDLSGYLSGAELFAYPSLGEGFGLPVLEAMAAGAAVLTTDRLALPEVGGDAVAYADVSADALARALTDLLADPVRTAGLRAAGQARAAGFTWAAAAAVHLAAYREAAARRA